MVDERVPAADVDRGLGRELLDEREQAGAVRPERDVSGGVLPGVVLEQRQHGAAAVAGDHQRPRPLGPGPERLEAFEPQHPLVPVSGRLGVRDGDGAEAAQQSVSASVSRAREQGTTDGFNEADRQRQERPED